MTAKNTTGIDLGLRNKFQRGSKFTDMESEENEGWTAPYRLEKRGVFTK